MRRRLCNDPARVSIHDGRPVLFWYADRECTVTALLKMVALVRLEDDTDTRLYQVRARCGDELEAVYELECDHGTWRLAAIWE